MADDPVEVTFLGIDPPEPADDPPSPAPTGRPARWRVGIALASAGALAAGVLIARGVAGDPAPNPSPVNTRPAPAATGRLLPPPIPLPSWSTGTPRARWSTVTPRPAGHSFRPL